MEKIGNTRNGGIRRRAGVVPCGAEKGGRARRRTTGWVSRSVAALGSGEYGRARRADVVRPGLARARSARRGAGFGVGVEDGRGFGVAWAWQDPALRGWRRHGSVRSGVTPTWSGWVSREP